jgi:hypothetical protein
MRAMRCLAFALIFAYSIAPAVAHAQSEEPTPPGGGSMKIDPNAPNDAPAIEKSSTPSPAAPADLGKYQLGARVRGIFVTHAMLSPYLGHNTGTSMNGYSVAGEFIYRRPSYDVVTSLDFSFYNVGDGNYLGSGHDPTLDTHYVQFRGLGLLSADVSLIGYHKFTDWFELRYGGGLGIGWVPGTVNVINNNSPGCATNAADSSKCYPLNVGPIVKGDPSVAGKLNATRGGDDTTETPHFHASNSKPPVMGVVNLLVGFRFYPIARLAITAEIGFRDAMFAGLGIHYLF